MPPDYSRILPWLFALLIPLALYRRFRRNFGRQPLRPRRMSIRIAIFLVLGATLVPVALRSSALALGELAGVLVGIALALWGASRTRFLSQDGRLYYVPHTYTGIAVSLVFVGRLVYRLAQLSSGGALAAPGATANGGAAGAPAGMVRSPLTVGIFFVLIGYYVCYYGLVLRKSKHITPADLEAAPPATPSADALTRGDTSR